MNSIGDQRQAGETGPAGDQREAGQGGPAGDQRQAGEARVSPADDPQTKTSKAPTKKA